MASNFDFLQAEPLFRDFAPIAVQALDEAKRENAALRREMEAAVPVPHERLRGVFPR